LVDRRQPHARIGLAVYSVLLGNSSYRRRLDWRVATPQIRHNPDGLSACCPHIGAVAVPAHGDPWTIAGLLRNQIFGHSLVACDGFQLNFCEAGEQDILSLSQRLYDPAAYSGGIIKITKREYRALPELNRRVMASTPSAILYPIHAWVEVRGVRHAERAA
jgi:hypothetical protein